MAKQHILGTTIICKLKVDNLPSTMTLNNVTKVEFFISGKYDPQAETGYQAFTFSNGSCTGNAEISDNYIICAVNSATVGKGQLSAYVTLTNSSVTIGSKSMSITDKLLVEFDDVQKIVE